MRRDLINSHCECYYSGVVSTFSYNGRLVARQQLLATSLRLDNTAPLGVENFCPHDLLLANSGFGGLNDSNLLCSTAPIAPSRRPAEIRDKPLQ
jgi:hypothetical protein